MAAPDPAVVILSYMSGVADFQQGVETTFLKALGSPKACATMKAAFDARCVDITAKRGTAPTIITAYHGTSLNAAVSIASGGFDPKYSTTAA